jgi:hypothetical protein
MMLRVCGAAARSAAVLATPGVTPFFDRDRGDDQGEGRVSPRTTRTGRRASTTLSTRPTIDVLGLEEAQVPIRTASGQA